MVELLAELRDEFGESRIFRPHRDTRFSADKTSYKTTLAATIGDGYIQLSADGLMAGAGMFHLEADQLERYRSGVADQDRGSALEEILASLDRTEIEIHGTDPLKTAPRGYPKDHPRIALLRNRGLVAMKMWPAAAWLGTATAKVRVVEILRAAQPLTGWLQETVGSRCVVRGQTS
jgi:uncharacterized protein (TIGR02453 family)